MHRAVLTVPLAALALGGCGSSDAAAATRVAVRATDTECGVDRTSLPPGRATFAVSNGGATATEVYLYQGTRIVAEKENIGPGTSVEFSADLPAGSYEVACKPGQTGDGIRTPVTVGG